MDIQVSLMVTSKTPISILLTRYFLFLQSAGLHCIPRVPLGTTAHTHADLQPRTTQLLEADGSLWMLTTVQFGSDMIAENQAP